MLYFGGRITGTGRWQSWHFLCTKLYWCASQWSLRQLIIFHLMQTEPMVQASKELSNWRSKNQLFHFYLSKFEEEKVKVMSLSGLLPFCFSTWQGDEMVIPVCCSGKRRIDLPRSPKLLMWRFSFFLSENPRTKKNPVVQTENPVCPRLSWENHLQFAHTTFPWWALMLLGPFLARVTTTESTTKALLLLNWHKWWPQLGNQTRPANWATKWHQYKLSLSI